MEFAGYAFERYFSIVSKAIKKHAPNHLYIGSRFMRPNYSNRFIWKAAKPYCDIITVNYYHTWARISTRWRTCSTLAESRS